MKTLRFKLVASAFILGIGGALATHANAHKTTTGTNYYWFDPSGTSFDQLSDESSEIMHTGCGTPPNVDCVRGYNSTQLNNASDPSQGVKSAEVDNYQDILYTQD